MMSVSPLSVSRKVIKQPRKNCRFLRRKPENVINIYGIQKNFDWANVVTYHVIFGMIFILSSYSSSQKSYLKYLIIPLDIFQWLIWLIVLLKVNSKIMDKLSLMIISCQATWLMSHYPVNDLATNWLVWWTFFLLMSLLTILTGKIDKWQQQFYVCSLSSVCMSNEDFAARTLQCFKLLPGQLFFSVKFESANVCVIPAHHHITTTVTYFFE